jgi:hypothetical protein
VLDIIRKSRGFDHEQIARHAIDQLLGRVANEKTPYAGTRDAAQHEDIGRKLRHTLCQDVGRMSADQMSVRRRYVTTFQDAV